MLHIYKGNSSFSPTYASPDTPTAGLWDRYVRYGTFTDDTESGWYSVQDSQIAIIAADLVANAVSVEYALSNSVSARAIADREIISYYEYEGDNFIAQTSPSGSFPSGVDFGDIWINQSHWNKQSDGSLSANAILRYQNTAGGSLDADGVSDTGANLSWNFAPNNAIGKVFLDAYLARNLADRKTTVFYAPNTGGLGPNPNTTPSGLDNPNPEGDMWIDTGGGVNRLYVYKTNTSFVIGGYESDYTNKKVWAQTTHSGIWNTGKFTGWWDAQDSEISLLRSNVGNILNDLGTIREQVDREVLAFFEPEVRGHSTPEIPIASGNNDVWIFSGYPVDLDGTPNTASIYVANSSPAVLVEYGEGAGVADDLFITDSGGSHWIPSPNNAIGLFYLESYSSGISGAYQRGDNIIPRGYSTFDQPTTDYGKFETGTSPDEGIPYPIRIVGPGPSTDEFGVDITPPIEEVFANVSIDTTVEIPRDSQ